MRLSALAVGALLLLAPVDAFTQVGLGTDLGPSEDAVSISTRLELSQLATADSVTDRNILYSDLRATFDGVGLGTPKLELHVDGRGRFGWNDYSPSRYDLTHAYLQYGSLRDAWHAGVGRLTITSLANVQIDGAQIGVRVAEGAHVYAFGGLMPHPITGSFNGKFINGGAAYEVRAKAHNHAGGVSVQLYEAQVDRVMFAERFYLRPHDTLMIAGHAVVDLVQREQFKKADLTSGFLMVRYQPASSFDVSVTGSHVHALLPQRWWEDWVEQERQRRGFTLDGPAPVGTRRTNARVVANVRMGAVTPYVVGRYDHRHEDAAHGLEGLVGLKLSQVGWGYADLSVAHRDYFETTNQLATVQLGVEAIDWLGIDAGGGVLRNVPDQTGEAEWLYDVNASLWVTAGQLTEALQGVYAMATYQLFIDPEMQFHVTLFKLGYRLRG